MPELKYIVICLVFNSVFFLESFSQIKSDSLPVNLMLAEHDTDKANAYALLCFDYSSTDAGKAIKYGIEGLKISFKARFYKGITDNLNNLGNTYFAVGNYAQAMQCFQSSLKVYRALGDLNGIAYCCYVIGKVLSQKGWYALSLKYNMESLKIYEKLNDKKGISKCYNNLGIICTYQKNFPLSLKYFRKALENSMNIGYDNATASAMGNIGSIYCFQKNDSMALKYYLMSLYFIKNHFDVTYSTTLNNIGNIYINQNKYEKALQYLDIAKAINEKINNKSGLSSTLLNLAELYKNTGNFKKSIEYAQKSLAIAEEINVPERISNATSILSDCYAMQLDFRNAYNYYKYFKRINDSIYNIASGRQIKEIETKYQVDKKEKENQILSQTNLIKDIKLKRRNLIIYFVLACSALVLILLTVVMYNFRQKQKAYRLVTEQNAVLSKQNIIIESQKKELADEKIKSDNILLKLLPNEVVNNLKTNNNLTIKHYEMLAELFSRLQNEKMLSQFEILKNQVNPHFLFNSLNVLSALVHIDPDLSEQFIVKLADAYRYVLEQKDKELVSLKTEIDFIQSFAFLMKVRFNNKIILKIDIDEEKQQWHIPPLTLQILVENAVKHNVFSVAHPLVIELLTEQKDYLIVRNNFNPRKKNVVSTGIGLQNIINRYKFYTEKLVEYGVDDVFFIVKIPLINLLKTKSDNAC